VCGSQLPTLLGRRAGGTIQWCSVWASLSYTDGADCCHGELLCWNGFGGEACDRQGIPFRQALYEQAYTDILQLHNLLIGASLACSTPLTERYVYLPGFIIVHVDTCTICRNDARMGRCEY
jgi:hypothetical protein